MLISTTDANMPVLQCLEFAVAHGLLETGI